MNYQLVSAAVIFCDNKYLVQKRPEGKPLAGFYEFPGGKVEQNETFEECLAREIKEELKVEVDRINMPRVCFQVYEQFIISAHEISIIGEPIPEIGQTIEWHTLDEIAQLNMLSSNYYILNSIKERINYDCN